MDYNQALTYLELLRPEGFHMELGPLKNACELAEDPQDKIPCVHIAGTNGKGSTAAFLANILKSSGYKVGVFTSPHLMDIRERIQINNKMISKSDFAENIMRIDELLLDKRSLSYFEMLCMLAFFYFSDQNVDIAIYETGLGGRLDGTNLINPLVSILTPISYDHMHHLGGSLAEIAREKCGIIKRGIPTVVSYQVPEVMDVIRRACDDMGSPLCLATPDEVTSELGLLGEHQRQNAACAVEAAHFLTQLEYKISNIEKALKSTVWPGRLENVMSNPCVLLDAAHNVAGSECLASFVKNNLKRKKSRLVLGVLADKDVAGIIRPLAPLFKEIVCVKAPSHRAASPKDLAAAVRSSGANVSIQETTGQAISKLLSEMNNDETLVVSGSLTLIGEAKEYFEKVKK